MRPQRGLMACLPIALVLLSGCASERVPQAAPLPPLVAASPSPPSALASPTPALASASPSAATPAAVAVDVPAAARANTPQGAGAYVRFYFDELLKAYVSQDTRTVRALAADSCTACSGFAGGIDATRAKNRRITGPPLEVLSAEAPGFGYGPVVVDLQYRIPSYDIVDAQGKIAYHIPAEGRDVFLVTLDRVGAEWRIGKVQVP